MCGVKVTNVMWHVFLCERNLVENVVRPGVLTDIFRFFSLSLSLSAVSEFSCWNGLPLSPCSYLFVDRMIQNNFIKEEDQIVSYKQGIFQSHNFCLPFMYLLFIRGVSGK